MSGAIAWNGDWGEPGRLGLPLDDRGLLLADGLFETVLVAGGQPRLLAEHLARWRQAAALLGMATPPAADRVAPLVAEAVRRSGIGDGALRLNWSRGSGARGLDPQPSGALPPTPRFWLQLTASATRFDAVTTILSRQERRNADSLVSRCKTFGYGAAIQARREASTAGADDALLLSTTGELCCGTTANLLVRRGDSWLTPPLSSGCLPGVMRGRALELGLAQEEHLHPTDLGRSDGALLINSLSCRPISRFETTPLPPLDGGALWHTLLDA